MAVNKVVYGNNTLIDITDSTVGVDSVKEGEIFYNAAGEKKVGQKKIGISVNQDIAMGERTSWVRPQEYPDLDSIQMDQDFEGWYLTYDLRKTPDYGWIGIYCKRIIVEWIRFVQCTQLYNGRRWDYNLRFH